MKRTTTILLDVIFLITAVSLIGWGTIVQRSPGGRPTAANQSSEQKTVEERLNNLEDNFADSKGFRDADYILRIQKQYESYYEKAFNTQVTIMTIFGLILTLSLWLAGRFGLDIFDRRIDGALKIALADLKSEMDLRIRSSLEKLANDNQAAVNALSESLRAEIRDIENNLKSYADYQFVFGQGLSFYAGEFYAKSVEFFTKSLEIFKKAKEKGQGDMNRGKGSVLHLFIALKRQHGDQFEVEAKKLLATDLLKNLAEELAMAAIDFPDLAPLLRDRTS